MIIHLVKNKGPRGVSLVLTTNKEELPPSFNGRYILRSTLNEGLNIAPATSDSHMADTVKPYEKGIDKLLFYPPIKHIGMPGWNGPAERMVVVPIKNGNGSINLPVINSTDLKARIPRAVSNRKPIPPQPPAKDIIAELQVLIRKVNRTAPKVPTLALQVENNKLFATYTKEHRI